VSNWGGLKIARVGKRFRPVFVLYPSTPNQRSKKVVFLNGRVTVGVTIANVEESEPISCSRVQSILNWK